MPGTGDSDHEKNAQERRFRCGTTEPVKRGRPPESAASLNIILHTLHIRYLYVDGGRSPLITKVRPGLVHHGPGPVPKV